jgi:hypothetical protein
MLLVSLLAGVMVVTVVGGTSFRIKMLDSLNPARNMGPFITYPLQSAVRLVGTTEEVLRGSDEEEEGANLTRKTYDLSPVLISSCLNQR